MTGESPLWDHRIECLLWTDIQRGHLHCFNPKDGSDSLADLGQQVARVLPAEHGGWIVGGAEGVFGLPHFGADLELVWPLEADVPENRCNDGACDPQGRLWMGTMSLERTSGAGSLYRLQSTPSGMRCDRVLTGLTISNGIGWSPDGELMYFVDSPAPRIDVFDFDGESGGIGNRRVFVEVEEALVPDGLTVDAEGRVWVAVHRSGEVRCYSPAGAVEVVVELPVTTPTSCTFGGATLSDLYITTASWRLSPEEQARQTLAGSLFRCTVDATGRPERAFDSAAR